MAYIIPEALAIADKFGGIWGAHPDWPVDAWNSEVANDDTRLGYWEWVLAKTEAY